MLSASLNKAFPSLLFLSVGVNFQPYGMPDLGDDDYSYDLDGSGFMDSSYQVIKWQSYNPTKWCPLVDADLKDL